MGSRYSAAMDAQARILNMVSTPGRLDYAVESILEYFGDTPAIRRRALTFTTATLASLKAGEPFYWSSEMCDVMSNAWKDFPTDFVLRMKDVPTPCGFFWFDKPVSLPTPDGTQNVHAVSWMPSTTEDHPGGLLLDSAHKDTVLANSSGIVVIFYTMQGGFVSPTIYFPWEFAASLSHQVSRYNVAPEAWRIAAQLQLLAACFMFLQQRVTVTKREPADRATRRRSGSLGQRDIRVVYLRRREEVGESREPGTREYSKRWYVSPHWRKQWYPSENRHKPIRIYSYVKGPANAPLDTTTVARVYAVTR